jgi:hypothetical protein
MTSKAKGKNQKAKILLRAGAWTAVQDLIFDFCLLIFDLSFLSF